MVNPPVGVVCVQTLYNPACDIQVVGNDVAPTSLKEGKEGKGEVAVIVVVVVFLWELCQMWKGKLPFREGARNPDAEAMPESRLGQISHNSDVLVWVVSIQCDISDMTCDWIH